MCICQKGNIDPKEIEQVFKSMMDFGKTVHLKEEVRDLTLIGVDYDSFL